MDRAFFDDNLDEIKIVMQKISELQFFAKENHLLRYVVKDFYGKVGNNKLKPAKEDELLYIFEKWGVITISSTDMEYEYSDDKQPIEIKNKVYYICTLPKFQNFYSIIDIPENVKLIYKKDDKYYFQNGKIDVKSNTLYYNIFDIVYSFSDKNGFISYDEIINNLKLRNLPISDSRNKNLKSINNAIINQNQGFFYYARINGKRILNQAPGGNFIFTTLRGSGIQFYNPKI